MRLGTVLRKWRMMENLSVRQVAKDMGTSPATLNRIERGFPCDSDTMATLFIWLLGKSKDKKAA